MRCVESRRARWSVGLCFADQQILEELRQGFSDDSQCKRGTLLCAPHGSALECYDIVREKLQKNTDEGWVSSGYDLPCWPLRTYPVGVVDESERAGRPKFRLTSDLSWPLPYTMPDGNGGFVDSVNDAMRRETWPDNRLIKVREFALCRRSLRSLRSLRSQGQQSFANKSLTGKSSAVTNGAAGRHGQAASSSSGTQQLLLADEPAFQRRQSVQAWNAAMCTAWQRSRTL